MENSNNILKIKELADNMRLKAMDMALSAGTNGSHLGAGLSSMEIIACLYGGIMNIDSKNPNKDGRDFFIPSKAHCVLAFYTALAYTGFFPVEELNNFEVNCFDLPGHPLMNISKGIEFSGGSLGMGFSQGVGLALAGKRKKNNSKVFVLLGDGECDEGSIWEAAMSAAHFKLDNLTVIVDNNKLQYDGGTEEVMSLLNLKSKFESFGFNVYEVDGHNIESLHDTLRKTEVLSNNKPSAVIADTIKGKGISFMENKKEWHHSILSKEQYDLAVCELNKRR